MRMSWRIGVDRDRLVTHTMLFCCWKLSAGEGGIDWLYGRAGEGEGGARGSDQTFSLAFCRRPIVLLVARQFPWSHQLVIINQSKRPKERIIYGLAFARGFVRSREQGEYAQ